MYLSFARERGKAYGQNWFNAVLRRQVAESITKQKAARVDIVLDCGDMPVQKSREYCGVPPYIASRATNEGKRLRSADALRGLSLEKPAYGSFT